MPPPTEKCPGAILPYVYNHLVVWRVRGTIFAVSKSSTFFSTLLGVGAVGAFVPFLVFLFFELLNIGPFDQYADRFYSFFFDGGGQLFETGLFIMKLLPLVGLYAYAVMKELTVFKKVTLVVFALVILMQSWAIPYILFLLTLPLDDIFITLSLVFIFTTFLHLIVESIYIVFFAVGLYFAGRSGSRLFKWGMVLGLISSVFFVINEIVSFSLFDYPHRFTDYYYQGDVITRSGEIFLYIFTASAYIQQILFFISYFLLGMLFLKTIRTIRLNR